MEENFKTEIEDEKRYIYIVLSSTNTSMGKLIRGVTRYEYNHVSLSFEEDLHKMFSFARYHVNSPLVGGFVEESALRYHLNMSHPTKIKVFKIVVEPDSYNELKQYIRKLQEEREQYIYNTFSAMVFPIHKSIRIERAYTCAEFIITVLKQCRIIDDTDKMYTLKELELELEKYYFYEGDMFQIVKFKGWENDQYLYRKSHLEIILDTMNHFRKQFSRVLDGIFG
ncbi:hypothetical protein [Anaeromicropila populeti]|uniref:Uncharacterized protein n=1 Tax=Anaeromicropila populeti TaxID=37658 RepID=A0A1I6HJF8_9FIRM|nr:hypothetical protein [Anaeromicropila populeti]SFR54619.1 hypothetical protein SAMN05661086_00040 [Anaeromicropila populeti]